MSSSQHSQIKNVNAPSSDNISVNGSEVEEKNIFGSVNLADIEIKSEVLHEGWLYKKGSGNDWLSSTSWKSRYGKLVLADIEGYLIDVPILMFHRSPYLAATSAINLDSTMVLPIETREHYEEEDLPSEESFLFEIIHIRGEQTNHYRRIQEQQQQHNERIASRKFSTAARIERDGWMNAFENATRDFEKRRVDDRMKRAMRKAQATLGVSRSMFHNNDDLHRTF